MKPNCPAYKWYGERGITICDEWKGTQGFIKFYEWSLANGYSDELSIDRIDNNKGYSPNNCRWTTKIIQANNTRANRYLTHNGETHTIADWARIAKMPYSTFAQRINKLGWDIEKAMTKEVRKVGVK